MWNWENNVVGDRLYYSRIIASWVKASRQTKALPFFGDNFREWMASIGVPEDDINNIFMMANNGKLELEISAQNWIRKHNK